jgi:hypothetical protein
MKKSKIKELLPGLTLGNEQKADGLPSSHAIANTHVVGSALCPPMTDEQKKEIAKISQQFARGFKEMFGSINGTGWLIVDPLSGYLNACDIENTLHQIPESDKHPQVLIMTFKDGSQFIPAGGDLKPIHQGFKNWMWL